MRKIKIAHFAAFCPQRTGQFATVKDMIKAERFVGIDSKFIATSINDKRQAGTIKEKQTDGWLETTDPEWSKKADIIMRHSCIPARYIDLGIPLMMCMHGRPESTFIIEYVGLMKIYQMIAEVVNDYRYKGWITFWKEHIFFHEQKLPKDSIYYVPAMVDLQEYCPEGKKVVFETNGGNPNIIVADMWRHDSTPYTMLYAAALFREKYCPESKVQVVGVPYKKCDTVIKVMKKRGVVGNMTHCVKPMANVYRGGDILITPHSIATRIVREALGCGLPIVAGSSCKYTKYRADSKDIEAFAKQINRCWRDFQKDEKGLREKARKTAEKEFSIEKAGEAILAAAEDVLKKENDSWRKKENVYFRNYKCYGDYLKHQTAKAKNVLTSIGKNYSTKYRASLAHRIKKIEEMGRISHGMSVLCLGARDGTEVKAFNDAGYFAVGMDLLPISQSLVLKGDFQKMSFPDHSVDVIFMNCVDHVYDLDKLLKDIIRILKVDGFLIIDFGIAAVTKRDRWSSCRWDSLEDIGIYIKKRGFSVENVMFFNDGYFSYTVCFRSLGDLNRSDIINSFIKRYKYKSYLEIGTKENENFDRIVCEKKVGVDPHYTTDYQMTSDEFFARCNSDKFDIIFIDGLHTAEQVFRDINNSLEHLRENGVVVVHDCNPTNKYLQMGTEPKGTDNWCGDGWKAFARLRMTRDDLTCYVINRDYGVGVINRGGQTIYDDQKEMNELDWDYLRRNRKELLRLREPEEWMIKQ